MKGFPLRLDEEMHRRLKLLMAKTDIPMAEHVRRALVQYLEEQERKEMEK